MLKRTGKVYLVGAGPGDRELITLKGLKVLKQADAVIYDRLVNPKLLEYAPRGALVRYVGKSPVKHTLKQGEINLLLVKLAKEGKTVVRLKGGDPFLFGRGAEEALTLSANKVPFEIIPGVTSAIAVPAYAGIPLTHRGFTSSLGIFTGQEDPAKEFTRLNWEKISRGLGTLVFLMGVENLPVIVSSLIKFGRSKNTPCGLIQQGTLPEQKTVVGKLGDILQKAKLAKVEPPAILVVGQVVSLRKKINWFESKPLFGKKILVTAPLESSPRLVERLEDKGAQCIELPLIKIIPLDSYSTLDSCIKGIKDFSWVIFSSSNGVRFFKERMERLKKDARTLTQIGLAVIGPRTRIALSEYLGLRADIEPKEFSQEGVVKSFKKQKIKGRNILLVRAKEARDVLPRELKKLGAHVTMAPAYKTVKAFTRKLANIQALKGVDLITFTSSSCVRNFFRAFPRANEYLRKNKVRAASIGPVTSQEARRFGLRVDIEAKKYTFEGLTEAIVKYFGV